MKNTSLNLVILFATIICLAGCKKKDNTKEEEPELPTVVTNPPPAGGDYWLTTKNTSTVYWTQDFIAYHEVSTALKAESIYLSGDTALFINNSDFTVKYGPVSNPANFKTVTTSKRVSNVGFAHGYIVAFSIDGNNKYIGYCNTKKGETSIQYTFLSNNESFQGFYKIRNSLLTNFSTNLGTTLAFTNISNDSLKWVLAPSPASGTYQYYDGGSGTTVAFSGWLSKTQSTDFKTANWTTVNISGTNTTDSSGSFGSYNSDPGTFMNINAKWKIYGMINMTSNGHKIHAVNTSADLGASWQTALLKGISTPTGNQNFTYKCLASKDVTFVLLSNNNGSNSIAFVYKSTDGINFTKILEGIEAQNLFDSCQSAVYIK